MLGKEITLSVALLLSDVVLAGDQIIKPVPVLQDISPNQTVNFDVKYSTNNPIDDSLTGIGVRLHWDSSILTFKALTHIFSTSTSTSLKCRVKML